MQNRSGADEPNARNDLRRDASVIGRFRRQRPRQDREQRGSETDEHVGAQPRGPVFQFPLQPYDPAENCRQHQTR